MPAATGIILAGGASTRLGRDKASEPLLGKPLLQWVVENVAQVVQEILIVKAAGQTLPPLEIDRTLRVVDDVLPSKGPLGGVYSGLREARCDLALAVGCDMPLLSVPLLAELLRLAEGYDVVMPRRRGRTQALHAVYRRSCIEPMRRELEAGRLKVISFLPAVKVRYVDEEVWTPFDPEGLSFFNVNTEEDVRHAAAMLQRRRL
jgi:molybdopterin-guanine dinucleotide biosynthesis protein A